ncbi:hypothetical protein Asal01_02570 [Fodinibius salicampi]
MTKQIKFYLAFIFCLAFIIGAATYPIDGYEKTGIERLLYLERIMSGEIKGELPPPGARKSIADIKLKLNGSRGDSLQEILSPDPELQKEVDAIFSTLDPSYSVGILDITEGRPIRYAQRKQNVGYQPGSVGKLAVLAGLFSELERLYPDSFTKRQELLREREVYGGRWVIPNQHNVPIYNPETGHYERRYVRQDDRFSLYEWTDHMISVSSNAAASVMWRECILMRAFGEEYPSLREEEAEEYFKTTPKKELAQIAVSIVNDPLRTIGITTNEWRLGRFFTREAANIVPPSGGSTGTTLGMMKFLVSMEKGEIVDPKSSLEMKRILYQTDRRIRYAASPALTNAAVYFKSGSLYKCQQEEGFKCGKYMGNVYNYMNSVAIVEHPDGRTYLAVLMSNVLRQNSSSDHYTLATRIDRLIK